MSTTLKRAACVTLVLLVMGAVARADVIIDLTTQGATASGTAFSGGTFIVQQIDPQSTGSGVIDSFLRINSASPGNPENEAGYNVAVNVAAPLDGVEGAFTRLLELGAVPIVTIDGVAYRQFILDINQNNSPTGSLLSLNQVQIFLGGVNGATGVTQGGQPCDSSVSSCSVVPNVTLAGLTEVFAMSGTSQVNQVKLDYSLNAGSGSGDMFLYVPAALFVGAGISDTTYVTLFSQFGNPTGEWAQNDGYEEWAVLAPAPVPEPGSLALLGSGLMVLAAAVRRRIGCGTGK